MQTIWKYDYAGIVVLIVASFIPPVFYGFLCEPLLRNFYLSTTSAMGEFQELQVLSTKYRPARGSKSVGNKSCVMDLQQDTAQMAVFGRDPYRVRDASALLPGQEV